MRKFIDFYYRLLDVLLIATVAILIVRSACRSFPASPR